MSDTKHERKDFFNKKGQLAGYLINGIYRKRVDSTKHKLKVMEAYGVDLDIINALKELGTTEIRVLETDTDTILSVNFEEFRTIGVIRNLDGLQVFLPTKYWSKEKFNRQSKIPIV